MRLFLAIDFPDDILEEVQSWVPEQKGWRKVGHHQMHLTLAFLGECSEQNKEEIHHELSGISFNPFELSISGLGTFPNESPPRIIWAGIESNDELMNLQEKISVQLEEYIKSKDAHSYVPHITIARIKSRKGMNHIIKQNLQRKTPAINVQVNEFLLKKSILKSSGSEYETLNIYKAQSGLK